MNSGRFLENIYHIIFLMTLHLIATEHALVLQSIVMHG